jgi:peptide deformylase
MTIKPVLRLGDPRLRQQAEPFAEMVLINPHMSPLGEERQAGWEGCLSVPGLRGRPGPP